MEPDGRGAATALGASQTLFATATHEAIGSSGAGKALNLALCGVDTTVWCRLGADEMGERVRAGLAAAGIELLTEPDPAGTMHHVNLMDPLGGRVSVFVNRGDLESAIGGSSRADLLARAK